MCVTRVLNIVGMKAQVPRNVSNCNQQTNAFVINISYIEEEQGKGKTQQG